MLLSDKIRNGDVDVSDLVGREVKKQYKVLTIKPSKNMLKDLPELPGNELAYSNYDVLHFLNNETDAGRKDMADYIALTENNFPRIFK